MSSIDDIVREIADETARDAARDEADSLGLVDEDRAVEIAEEAAREHAGSEGVDLHQVNGHLDSVARMSDCSDGDPFRQAVLSVVLRAMGLTSPTTSFDPNDLVRASRSTEGPVADALARALGGGGRQVPAVPRIDGGNRWSRLAHLGDSEADPLIQTCDRLARCRMPATYDVREWDGTPAVRRMVRLLEMDGVTGWSDDRAVEYVRAQRGDLLLRAIARLFIPVPLVWSGGDEAGALYLPWHGSQVPVGVPWQGMAHSIDGDGRRIVAALCLRPYAPDLSRPEPSMAVPRLMTGLAGALPPCVAEMLSPTWTPDLINQAVRGALPGGPEREWHRVAAARVRAAVESLHGLVLPNPGSDVDALAGGNPWSGSLGEYPNESAWAEQTFIREVVGAALIGRTASWGRGGGPAVRWDRLSVVPDGDHGVRTTIPLRPDTVQGAAPATWSGPWATSHTT